MTGTERAPIETKIKNLQAQSEKKKKDLAAAAQPVAAPPAEVVVVREHTAGPWVVIGVGSAALVTGIVLLAVAPKFPAECSKNSENCNQPPFELSTNPNPKIAADENKKAQEAALKKVQNQATLAQGMPIGGVACVIGGGALLIGGTLWHFLEPTGPVTRAKLPSVTPAVGPGYGGIALGGVF